MSKIDWDQYFMSMSYFVAMKSKDPSTKIGAVIVGPDQEVRSTGYNGLPRGVNDNVPERDTRPTKYFYYEHAERNAILNAARMGIRTEGCTMYTPGLPCADCCRAIIQSGISKLVYDWRWDKEARMNTESNQKWLESCSYSKNMFTESGVEVVEYTGPLMTEITALRGDKALNLKMERPVAGKALTKGVPVPNEACAVGCSVIEHGPGGDANCPDCTCEETK